MRANERDNSPSQNVACIIQFLDNTQHRFLIDRRCKGQALLDCVFKHLNLIETDFFGLKFIPHEQHCLASLKNSNHTLTTSQLFTSHEDNSSPVTSSASSSTTEGNNYYSKPDQINKTIDNSKHDEDIKNPKDNQIFSDDVESLNIDKTTTNKSTIQLVSGRWLDPTKSIKKQCKSSLPYRFYFRVKFYVSDPGKLADDTTRNYLYQQLRLDIFSNRLVVPTCSAILLASYILQSEVGDYKHDLSEDSYVSNFRLLPNQSDDFNKKVIELHKQHKSLSSADAEYNFLEHAAKKLDCYGVEFYDAQDLNKTDVKIGVSSSGIIVFKDGKKMDQFSWAKILKIIFKKRIFSIQLRREERGNCDNVLEFNLLTNQLCKSFWEECVAQHSFFRLHQPKSPPKKFFSFLNFGSRFQYNGKTEYQTMEESKKRSFSHFSRSPSKRYARVTIPIGRPSWSSSGNSKKDSVDNQDSNERLDDQGTKMQPIASGSSNSRQSTITDTSSASYRPKSLTLKSFMYIDESQITSNSDRNLSKNCTNKSNSHDIDVAKSQNTVTNSRRDLKRCESLRIPDSIKEAIYLTKKAGVTSSNQLAKLSGSLRDKFMVVKSRSPKNKMINGDSIEEQECSDDLETISETNPKILRLTPAKDGRFGFKIEKIQRNKQPSSRKEKKRSIIIYQVFPNSPASTGESRLHEGDEIISINGTVVEGMSLSKVKKMITSIQHLKPAELIIEVNSRYNGDESDGSVDEPRSSTPSSRLIEPTTTLSASIREIKEGLRTRKLIDDFEKLSRKKEDESLEESRLMENIDKNRYQDILPYDSTRVQLIDSMTGDYINASFVNMLVPSGSLNRYIATQGPLASTCDDFWQMVWEQNCSLIIMVTPLIEGGRIKCHKYWPDEREEIRHGQILVRNIHEKPKAATIDRTIQLLDVKVSFSIDYFE